MIGWHHRLNGHEFEETLGDCEGQGGLACCSSRDCKELDMTYRLNNSKGVPGALSLHREIFLLFACFSFLCCILPLCDVITSMACSGPACAWVAITVIWDTSCKLLVSITYWPPPRDSPVQDGPK